MKTFNLHQILFVFIGTLVFSCSSDDDSGSVERSVDQERFEAVSQYQLLKENGIEPIIVVGHEKELNYQMYIDRKFWEAEVTVRVKSLPQGVSLSYEGKELVQGNTFIHDFKVETEEDEEVTYDSTMVLNILAMESGDKTIVYEFTTPLGNKHLLEENIRIRE